MQKHSFLLPLIAEVSGILLWKIFKLPSIGFIIIASALMVYALISIKSNNIPNLLRLNKYHFTWLVLLFCGIGYTTSYYHAPTHLSPLHNNQKSHRLSARIIQIDSYSSGDRLFVELLNHHDSEPIYNSQAYIYSDPTKFSPGDIISIPCKLQFIENSADRFGTDYISSLHNKGILYSQKSDSREIIKIGHKTSLRICAINIRDNIEQKIQSSGLDKTTSSFLIATILGDRRFLSHEVSDIFSDAGISHILALSGMHVAIIVSIILFVLFPLSVIGHYKWRFPVAIIILWIYIFITGLPPSTMRAAGMATFILMALYFERKKSSLNALFCATFIILLIYPSDLFDIGLQLSFVAVASIILFANNLNPFSHRHHPISFNTAGLVITSIVATFSTFMLIAYYFHRIPMMFLPVNLIAVPLLPVFLSIGIVYIIFSSLGVNLFFLKLILESSLNHFIKFSEFIISEGTTSSFFAPSIISVIIWFSVLIIIALRINSKKKGSYNIPIVITFSIFIVSLFIFPGKLPPDSFIIRSRTDQISIVCYDKGREIILTIPPRKVTLLSLHGKGITIADGIPEDVEENQLNQLSKSDHCHYLIIGPACYADPLKISKAANPDTIILHNSINYKLSAFIRKELQKSSIPIIDMRDHGHISVIPNKVEQ